MVCPLSEEETFVLKILVKNRCFGRDRGYHSEKLRNRYLRKFPKRRGHMKFDRCLQNLMNKGYISRVGKSPEKYYVADEAKALIDLGECGVSVPKGRIHSL